MTLRNNLLFLSAFSLLIYAPNYLSLVLPIVKIIPLLSLFFNLIFLLKQNNFTVSMNILFLGVIIILIFMMGLYNGIRFDNFDSINFSFSFLLKFIHILSIYLLINSLDYFYKFIKYLLFGILFIALHTILQFILNMFSIIPTLGTIETQGYTYINLGVWGFYRVGFTLFDLNFIRAQSFFQEPAFLAFYFIFGLMLLFYIEKEYKINYKKLYQYIISIGIILTFSFTGLFLLMVLYLLYEKSKSIKISILIITIAAIVYILLSENPYVNKIGSFLLRYEDFLDILEIFNYKLNYLIGIGYNNEHEYITAKANNFIIELFMYGSAISLFLFILFILFFMSIHKGEQVGLLIIPLLFCLTVPLFWSPIIVLAIVLIEKKAFLLKEINEFSI